jgi:hypothetical protein
MGFPIPITYVTTISMRMEMTAGKSNQKKTSDSDGLSKDAVML